MRYERDELPTHAGALTYGAFLSLPPLLLLAASVVGFAIADPAKQEQVINSLVDLIPGLDAVAASLVDSVVNGRVALGLIAIPGVLWAAPGLVARLRHALGVVFGTRWTGLISGRFRGMVVAIPLLAGVLVVLALPGAVSGLAAPGVVSALVELLIYLAVLVGGIAFFLVVSVSSLLGVRSRGVTICPAPSWRRSAGCCSNGLERSTWTVSSRVAPRSMERSALSSGCLPTST